MRVHPIQSLFVFFLASVLGSSVSALEVCDETAFLDKPDVSKYMVKKTRLIYAQELWLPGEDLQLLPPQQRVIDYVSSKYGSYQDILIPDIEQWPFYGIPDEEFYINLDKIVTLMGWIKSAAPLAQLGMYGQPPSTELHKAILDPSDPKYQQWQDHNDKFDPLTDMLDVLNPILYTVNEDSNFWINAATGYVSEAKRISGGAPVYAFLAPNYHDSAASPPEIRDTPISQDFFSLQLQTLEDLGADCAVIWAVKKTTPWDENAPWWLATKEFLSGALPTPEPGSSSAPAPDPAPAPAPGSSSVPVSKRIVREAERATVLVGMVTATDSAASGGKYIWLPNGSTNEAEARFVFQLNTAGTYRVIGRVSAANTQDDSFRLRVDGGSSNDWFVGVGSWHETTHPRSFQLGAGTHTVVVSSREDGTKLDLLALELQ